MYTSLKSSIGGFSFLKDVALKHRSTARGAAGRLKGSSGRADSRNSHCGAQPSMGGVKTEV